MTMTEVPLSIKRAASDRDLEVTVRIGRSGLNEAVIEELCSQLAKRRLVKVKLNRGIVEGSEERKNLFDYLAKNSDSILVYSRGNVATYWIGKN
jgi:RNA-binding protein YhbY